MADYQFTGTLKKVHPQVERGNFVSRKVWFDAEPGQHPQVYEVEVSQAKVNLFNNIPIGTECTVSFNIRGRVWQGNGEPKCFVTLSCWKATANGKAVDAGAYVAAPQGYVQNTQPAGGQYAPQQGGTVNEDPGDLPF